MTVVLVELHTINTERLESSPLSTRVIKARIASFLVSQPELLQPTVQKLRPSQTLWQDELKQLKINDRILEKYPLVGDFLVSHVQEQIQQLPYIFVPANLEAQEILLEIQQQPESAFFGQPVVALSPGVVQIVTNLCFDAHVSLQQMTHVLQEEAKPMFEGSDDDLMAEPLQPTDFASLLEYQPNQLDSYFLPQ